MQDEKQAVSGSAGYDAVAEAIENLRRDIALRIDTERLLAELEAQEDLPERLPEEPEEESPAEEEADTECGDNVPYEDGPEPDSGKGDVYSEKAVPSGRGPVPAGAMPDGEGADDASGAGRPRDGSGLQMAPVAGAAGMGLAASEGAGSQEHFVFDVPETPDGAPQGDDGVSIIQRDYYENRYTHAGSVVGGLEKGEHYADEEAGGDAPAMEPFAVPERETGKKKDVTSASGPSAVPDAAAHGEDPFAAREDAGPSGRDRSVFGKPGAQGGGAANDDGVSLLQRDYYENRYTHAGSVVGGLEKGEHYADADPSKYEYYANAGTAAGAASGSDPFSVDSREVRMPGRGNMGGVFRDGPGYGAEGQREPEDPSRTAGYDGSAAERSFERSHPVDGESAPGRVRTDSSHSAGGASGISGETAPAGTEEGMPDVRVREPAKSTERGRTAEQDGGVPERDVPAGPDEYVYVGPAQVQDAPERGGAGISDSGRPASGHGIVDDIPADSRDADGISGASSVNHGETYGYAPGTGRNAPDAGSRRGKDGSFRGRGAASGQDMEDLRRTDRSPHPAPGSAGTSGRPGRREPGYAYMDGASASAEGFADGQGRRGGSVRTGAPDGRGTVGTSGDPRMRGRRYGAAAAESGSPEDMYAAPLRDRRDPDAARKPARGITDQDADGQTAGASYAGAYSPGSRPGGQDAGSDGAHGEHMGAGVSGQDAALYGRQSHDLRVHGSEPGRSSGASGRVRTFADEAAGTRISDGESPRIRKPGEDVERVRASADESGQDMEDLRRTDRSPHPAPGSASTSGRPGQHEPGYAYMGGASASAEGFADGQGRRGGSVRTGAPDGRGTVGTSGDPRMRGRRYGAAAAESGSPEDMYAAPLRDRRDPDAARKPARGITDQDADGQAAGASYAGAYSPGSRPGGQDAGSDGAYGEHMGAGVSGQDAALYGRQSHDLRVHGSEPGQSSGASGRVRTFADEAAGTRISDGESSRIRKPGEDVERVRASADESGHIRTNGPRPRGGAGAQARGSADFDGNSGAAASRQPYADASGNGAQAGRRVGSAGAEAENAERSARDGVYSSADYEVYGRDDADASVPSGASGYHGQAYDVRRNTRNVYGLGSYDHSAYEVGTRETPADTEMSDRLYQEKLDTRMMRSFTPSRMDESKVARITGGKAEIFGSPGSPAAALAGTGAAAARAAAGRPSAPGRHGVPGSGAEDGEIRPGLSASHEAALSARTNTRNTEFVEHMSGKITEGRLKRIRNTAALLINPVGAITGQAGMMRGPKIGTGRQAAARPADTSPKGGPQDTETEGQQETQGKKKTKKEQPRRMRFRIGKYGGAVAVFVAIAMLFHYGAPSVLMFGPYPAAERVWYDATGENRDPLTQAAHGVMKSRYEAIKSKVAYGDNYSSGSFFDGTSNAVFDSQDLWSGGSYRFSEDQFNQIASLCHQENGSPDGVAYEMCLILNHYELGMFDPSIFLKGSAMKNAIASMTPEEGVIYMLKNEGWWCRAQYYMGLRTPISDAESASIKAVMSGKRPIPVYIDEHDCFGDISYVEKANPDGSYQKDVTIIHNRYSSTYTYYGRPDRYSDPFGYTQHAYNVAQKFSAAPNQAKVGSGLFTYQTVPDETNIGTAGDKNITSSNATITTEQLITAVDEVMKRARAGGYEYGNSGSTTAPCDDGIISCDRMIARALWDLGFTDQPMPNNKSTCDLWTGCAGVTCGNIGEYLVSKGWIESFSPNDIRRGSIINVQHEGNNYWDHTFMALSFDPNTFVTDRYDAGTQSKILSPQPLMAQTWGYKHEPIAVYNLPDNGINGGGTTTGEGYDGSLNLPVIPCTKAKIIFADGTEEELPESERNWIAENGVANYKVEHHYDGTEFHTVEVVDAIKYALKPVQVWNETLERYITYYVDDNGPLDTTEAGHVQSVKQMYLNNLFPKIIRNSSTIPTSTMAQIETLRNLRWGTVGQRVKDKMDPSGVLLKAIRPEAVVHHPERYLDMERQTTKTKYSGNKDYNKVLDYRSHKETRAVGPADATLNMDVKDPVINVVFMGKIRDAADRVQNWPNEEGEYEYETSYTKIHTNQDRVYDEDSYFQMLLNALTIGSGNCDPIKQNGAVYDAETYGLAAEKFVHLDEQQEADRVEAILEKWEEEDKKDEEMKTPFEEADPDVSKEERIRRMAEYEELDNEKFTIYPFRHLDTQASYWAKMGYLEYACDVVDASFACVKERGFEVEYRVNFNPDGLVTWDTSGGYAEATGSYELEPNITLYVGASPDDIPDSLKKLSNAMNDEVEPGTDWTTEEKMLLYQYYACSYEYFKQVYRISKLQRLNENYGDHGNGLNGEARIIYTFLHGHGLNDAQIAGILGNFAQECGGQKLEEINHALVESNGEGIGLMQWSFDRKTALINFAKQHNKDPEDLELQLEFLWDEEFVRKENWYGYYDKFMHAKTPEEAAHYFLLGPEAGGFGTYISHMPAPFRPFSGWQDALRDYDGYQKYIEADKDANTGKSLRERDTFWCEVGVRVPEAQRAFQLMQGGGLGTLVGTMDANGIMEVPYFNQGAGQYIGGDQFIHSEWASATFKANGHTMQQAGCGFCSTAMALSYLKGQIISPVEFMENGMYVPGSGADQNIGIATAATYGLTAHRVSQMSDVIKALNEGHPVMAHVGPSVFTRGGHYILLVGVMPDGTIAVNDPGHRDNTYFCNGTTFPASVIQNAVNAKADSDSMPFTVFGV